MCQQDGLGDDGGELSLFQKIYVFYRQVTPQSSSSHCSYLDRHLNYRSPVIKYTGTCVSYILLVMLYSYVALYGYRQEYQLPEILLYIWILVLIVDELREVLTTSLIKCHSSYC